MTDFNKSSVDKGHGHAVNYLGGWRGDDWSSVKILHSKNNNTDFPKNLKSAYFEIINVSVESSFIYFLTFKIVFIRKRNQCWCPFVTTATKIKEDQMLMNLQVAILTLENFSDVVSLLLSSCFFNPIYG